LNFSSFLGPLSKEEERECVADKYTFTDYKIVYPHDQGEGDKGV
jgi:hypothetical protein